MKRTCMVGTVNCDAEQVRDDSCYTLDLNSRDSWMVIGRIRVGKNATMKSEKMQSKFTSQPEQLGDFPSSAVPTLELNDDIPTLLHNNSHENNDDQISMRHPRQKISLFHIFQVGNCRKVRFVYGYSPNPFHHQSSSWI